VLTPKGEWAAEAQRLQREREDRERRVAEEQAAKLRTVGSGSWNAQ
jgi:hypothetical protein